MKKEKIILTTGGIPALNIQGGIVSYVHELANNLCDNGYDVMVYVIRESFEDDITFNEKYSCKLFKMPSKRADERYLVKELLKKIEDYNPDIIINNEIPYIAGLLPVLNNNIIKISIVHGFHPNRTFTIAGIQGKIASYNWQWLDWIICQNSQMTEGLINKYGVAKDRVKYILQTSNIDETPNLSPNKTFTIVYAGGDSKYKGSTEMTKICRKLQKTDMDFKVIWCLTANNVKDELKNDDRFIFPGKLSRTDFINTLNNADCIIIPSHMETGPMLLVEAMSVGTIPICNNIKYSAIPDIIQNAINGFCIENNSIENYISTIKELYYNREKVSLLKHNGYNYFIENLTPIHQINNFISLFKKNCCNLAKLEIFEDKHIIHNTHKYNTAMLPKYSLKRMITKLINGNEIIIKETIYKRLLKYFIK